MHWNKHHIADRLACRLLRHWRTADNDQGINLCNKINLIASDKRQALCLDFIELFIYVHIFSRTRSQWRWTPSSSSRSISMNQGRGAGVGYRTLRDRNFKKHVTITTITKMCSTLLLQLVAEVRHNCILNWDNIRLTRNFKVFNPLAAVCNNKNYRHSTLTLARTMLRFSRVPVC